MLSLAPLAMDDFAQGEREAPRDRANRLRRERRILLTGQTTVWSLPAEGEAGAYCGHFRHTPTGCLNVSAHPEGKVYVENHAIHCKDPRCPVCFPTWVHRETVSTIQRIQQFQKQYSHPPKHATLSPPKRLYYLASKNYKDLKRRAYEIAKRVGILGGTLVFHPFRYDKYTQKWHFSPHFHAFCFGYIDNVSETYAKTGWVTKNFGSRDNYDEQYKTIRYELSHCGISQKVNRRSLNSAISWFGALSYNKLPMPKKSKITICPYCSENLIKIRWWGTGIHPLQDLIEGEYLLDPDGWDYAEERENYY